MVGKYIFLGNSPHRQNGAIIGAHHRTAAIGPSDELVILAAVNLHLLLVEPVPKIAGRLFKWVVERAAVNAEEVVGEMQSLCLADHRRCILGRKPAPAGRQFGEWFT